MEERVVKTVKVISDRDDKVTEFPGGLYELRDVEIWNTKGKIANEEISQIIEPLVFVGIVNPQFTPVWAIIDKPYNVYSLNEKTLESFKALLNHSNIVNNVADRSMLVKVRNCIYLLFYIEQHNGGDEATVKCLLLDLNWNKIDEVIEKFKSNSLCTAPSESSYFIDEVVTKKDEVIDTLLRTRILKNNNERLKRQLSEQNVKEQQLRLLQIRQAFKRIINKEITRRAKQHKKSVQTELAETCYKAMNFRFKELKELREEQEQEVRRWLRVFLDLLGL